MEALQTLPNISKLNDYVVRILGQNPGKFTLQGTNVYLVGRDPPYILIDTGEGREEFIPLLESVLRQPQQSSIPAANGLISDIIITHRHRDHFGGLTSVLDLLRKLHSEKNSESNYVGPRIHKYPSPPQSGSSPHQSDLDSIISSLTPSAYAPSPSGAPLHDLRDLQRFETSDGSLCLGIYHTPGHTPDSVCLLLQDLSNAGEQVTSLFTADSVLGQGTAVFEDLGIYLESLQRLLSIREDKSARASFKIVYPGHGPVVDDGPKLISAYIKHRLKREDQIVGVLNSPVSTQKAESNEHSDGSWTIWAIVREIYKDYPENLWLPAAHGVELHLKKLERDGRARCFGGEGIDQRWALLSRL